MLPMELKIDKEGLLYIDDNKDMYSRLLFLDKRKDKHEYYASVFYRLFSTDDYIIKQSITVPTRIQRNAYKNMLTELVLRQKEIKKTDFPIGYYRQWKKLAGMIIRYYKDGISLDNITKEKDINLVSKYYYHDEDNIHNLFLLFNEILCALYEMFEHGIYYTDVNTGNFVIVENKVKIIDFDPVYVKFENKDQKLPLILERFFKSIELTLNDYELPYIYDDVHNFEEAKVFTKKIENHIKKNN